jgi:hypothetical protein
VDVMILSSVPVGCICYGSLLYDQAWAVSYRLSRDPQDSMHQLITV